MNRDPFDQPEWDFSRPMSSKPRRPTLVLDARREYGELATIRIETESERAKAARGMARIIVIAAIAYAFVGLVMCL